MLMACKEKNFFYGVEEIIFAVKPINNQVDVTIMIPIMA